MYSGRDIAILQLFCVYCRTQQMSKFLAMLGTRIFIVEAGKIGNRRRH